MEAGANRKEQPVSNGIGVLGENSLHADLKAWYAQPGDRQEIAVDGYWIDIVRGEQLIEIQTRNFSALKNKLARLVDTHPVRLVHPIAVERWIVRMPAEGETPLERRRSPRRGSLLHLFLELVRIPDLITHPNFTLEVVFTREEEIRRQGAATIRRASWRKKGWNITDRRLLEVVDQRLFETPADFQALLPAGLPETFTARDLSRALGQPAYIGQKMAYCLRLMGAIEQVGKRKRSYLYRIANETRLG